MTLLVAILEKRMDLHLQGEDIFVNIAGGLKVGEPAIDLGMAVAIAGSFQNRVVDPGMVCIGEVGLTGEVRSVGQLEARVHEAARLGFTRCLVPGADKMKTIKPPRGMELIRVKSLMEAFQAVFD